MLDHLVEIGREDPDVRIAGEGEHELALDLLPAPLVLDERLVLRVGVRSVWRTRVAQRVLGGPQAIADRRRAAFIVLDVDVAKPSGRKHTVPQAAWARNVQGYGSSGRDLQHCRLNFGCLL